MNQTSAAMERARNLIDGLSDGDVGLEVWRALDALMRVFEAMAWDVTKMPVVSLDDIVKATKESKKKAEPQGSVDQESRAYL